MVHGIRDQDTSPSSKKRKSVAGDVGAQQDRGGRVGLPV
jgi:hypothetical protein